MAKAKTTEEVVDKTSTDNESKELARELVEAIRGAEPPKIYEAMLGIMADMDAIVKTKQSSGVNYAFRSIDDVMNTLHPLLVKHGVFIVPVLNRLSNQVFESDKVDTQGRPTGAKRLQFQSIVESAYRFTAIDGSYVEAVVGSESTDFSDKATQQALSYCFKIAILQIFCVPTKELITDGDERTPEVTGKKAQPAGQQKTAAPAPEPAPVEVMPKEAWDTLKEQLKEFELDERRFTNWVVMALRANNIEVPKEMAKLPKAQGRVLYPIAVQSKENKKLLDRLLAEGETAESREDLPI